MIMGKPILFNTDMVRAILEGRKTQTRRPMKGEPESPILEEATNGWKKYGNWVAKKQIQNDPPAFEITNIFRSPYSAEDVLYVRETFYAYGYWIEVMDEETAKLKWHFEDFTLQEGYKYMYEDFKPKKVHKRMKSTAGLLPTDPKLAEHTGYHRRPSIHMPKEAARIWLRVTNVKAERVQDISEQGAKAEGMEDEAWLDFVEHAQSVAIPGSKIQTLPEKFGSIWQSVYGIESWEKNQWVWVISFDLLSTTGKPANLQNLSVPNSQFLINQ
jgi:hypothetical protein